MTNENTDDLWGHMAAYAAVDLLSDLPDDPGDRFRESLARTEPHEDHASPGKIAEALGVIATVGLTILFPSGSPDQMLPAQDGGSDKDIDGA